jgi:hypothetical protein
MAGDTKRFFREGSGFTTRERKYFELYVTTIL